MIQTEKTVDTYWARIYMSGPIDQARQVMREACLVGACVTVEACDFIYTRGEESGFVIGFVNYPRFPSTPDAIFEQACLFANMLLNRLFQGSALVVGPEKTTWISRRDQDKA